MIQHVKSIRIEGAIILGRVRVDRSFLAFQHGAGRRLRQMRRPRVYAEFLIDGFVVVDVGYLRIDTDVFCGHRAAEDFVFARDEVAGVSGHERDVTVVLVAAMLNARPHFRARPDFHEVSRVYATAQGVARHDFASRACPLPVYWMELLT